MSDKKKNKKTVLGHDPFSDMNTIDIDFSNKNNENNKTETKPEINLSILESDNDDAHKINTTNDLINIIQPSIEENLSENDKPDSKSEKPTKQEQFIIFTMEDSDFAAPLANVVEIRRPVEITSLPNLPSWILGIANLRGEILSIINLKLFLNIKQQRYKNPSRMIVAHTKDKEIVLGFMVDRVKGIHYLSLDQINTTDNTPISFISGSIENKSTFLKILDIEALLLSPEIQKFEQH